LISQSLPYLETGTIVITHAFHNWKEGVELLIPISIFMVTGVSISGRASDISDKTDYLLAQTE